MPQQHDMPPAFSRTVATHLFYLCSFSSLRVISLFGGVCWAEKADAGQIAVRKSCLVHEARSTLPTGRALPLRPQSHMISRYEGLSCDHRRIR